MAVLKGACTFFIGLLSLPVSHVFAKVNDVAEFEEAKGYLRDTVAALDWLTWYVEHHYEEGNLDLFIGTRIAEGQCSVMRRRLRCNSSAENPKVPDVFWGGIEMYL